VQQCNADKVKNKLPVEDIKIANCTVCKIQQKNNAEQNLYTIRNAERLNEKITTSMYRRGSLA